MDYDDEVLYVYEIQLEDVVRRKGLGKFMMQVRRKKRRGREGCFFKLAFNFANPTPFFFF